MGHENVSLMPSPTHPTPSLKTTEDITFWAGSNNWGIEMICSRFAQKLVPSLVIAVIIIIMIMIIPNKENLQRV